MIRHIQPSLLHEIICPLKNSELDVKQATKALLGPRYFLFILIASTSFFLFYFLGNINLLFLATLILSQGSQFFCFNLSSNLAILPPPRGL